MIIAVLADLHGRLLLAFKILDRYQRETGERIDLILQCGDVGIFPDVARLDKATKRIAESDPTELGFAAFFVSPMAEAEEVLDRVSCDMICVRGNHEDHEYLDHLEEESDGPVFSVDCYRRIWCMKTGLVHEIRRGDTLLRLLGIGRVGAPAGEKQPFCEKYIQTYEQDRISRMNGNIFDVLVTHDARRDFIRPGIGMMEISAVLDRQAPSYHFFGHTGQPFEKSFDKNGVTACSKLSDFEWEESDRGGHLKEGCLGILRWKDEADHEFEVFDAPWLKEYTPHTWPYL